MIKKFIIIITLLVLTAACMAQSNPEMRLEDRIRIREAVEISNNLGEQIWNGISKVPFTIILVSDTIEFLVYHPYPSNDFTLLGYDSLLQSNVLYRKAQFNKHFLATFPAVNGVNCIVVGTPENTGKTSTQWIITLLHEHFHQYQYTYPDYYANVDKLGLAAEDKTGMWMLNYPFAYADININERFNKYVKCLSRVVNSITQKTFWPNFKLYITEREKFKQLLDTNDYKYFSFQIWQEGLARYTEYKFLELLKTYKPSDGIKKLTDFIPYSKYENDLYQSELQLLTDLILNKHQRICFYTIGFAEGLLLDKLNANWHDSYLTNKFYIERYSEHMSE